MAGLSKILPYQILSSWGSHQKQHFCLLGNDQVSIGKYFLSCLLTVVSVRLEDGSQHKNLRIFSVTTGEEVIAFTQKSQEGWDLQYTASESHAVRLSGSEVQVFNPADWAKGVIDKLKVEGCTSVALSPGLNPHIAVFVAEKKGAPAMIRIYGLVTLSSPPTSQKTFYKSDRATIKWNALGTQVLVLTQTEVDKTNKSYYGETGLYLLSAAGNFDCRVTLDKEGPIHDFAWSPNSKEFGVVYGCKICSIFSYQILT